MVHVLLKGRIGNNLFQIAAGATLAYKNNTELYVYSGDYFAPFPDNCSLFDYLQQFKENILRNISIREGFPEKGNPYHEIQFHHSPIEYIEDITISGFFQSYKYFDEEYIKSLFAIDEKTKTYIEVKYGEILKKGVTSINVRRGDYLKELDNHPICSLNYFINAIQHIGNDKSYLIISDDIEWCKKKFKGNNFFFVEKESPLIDLYLQTMCENNIISNSTFSWWGAYLNNNKDKTVIYPTPWFGVAKQDISTKDLCPKNWIILPNKIKISHTFKGYYIWWKKRTDFYFRTHFKTL